MTLIWASRQMFSASASLGTMARAAGVSIAAPAATKSFCISTTIMAVFCASITLICMTCLLEDVAHPTLFTVLVRSLLPLRSHRDTLLFGNNCMGAVGCHPPRLYSER